MDLMSITAPSPSLPLSARRPGGVEAWCDAAFIARPHARTAKAAFISSHLISSHLATYSWVTLLDFVF
jgi:hypothetical protein